MPNGPGFEALRRGRVSQSGARYFVTLCLKPRRSGLSSTLIATILRRETTALEADHSWRLHGAVIMPDHFHLVFTLHDRLTLGQAIGRFKAKTRTALTSAALAWQGSYFEHRLRPDEHLESVLRYMFLNPYRAHLLPVTECYPWFWLGIEEAIWFHASPSDQLPSLAWLG